jgi:ABC-type glycerol-3-phosphate transport system permease component
MKPIRRRVSGAAIYLALSVGAVISIAPYREDASQLHMLPAAAVALLPLIAVFLLFQRQIVRSIALTGLK